MNVKSVVHFYGIPSESAVKFTRLLGFWNLRCGGIKFDDAPPSPARFNVSNCLVWWNPKDEKKIRSSVEFTSGTFISGETSSEWVFQRCNRVVRFNHIGYASFR